jgi:signal transduction histidine kinase/ActR/RegA family two-component response regulator
VLQVNLGNLDVAVPYFFNDEMSQMIQSFNTMVQSLKTSRDELQQANVLLEARVQERTQQLAEAKAAADTANQAKSTFLANMSHELRTPLNAVLGYAQLLKHKPDLPKDIREYMGIIYQSGEQLLSLINDVLDLARIEAGKVQLQSASIALSPFLQGVARLVQLQASQKDLLFTYEVAPTLPAYVRGDERLLRQVLLNLLSNAVKYTDAGKVTLRVGSKGQGARSKEKADKEDGSTELAEVKGMSGDKENQIARGDFPSLLLAERKDGEEKAVSLSPGLPISRSSSSLLCFEVIDTGIGIHADHLERIFLPFEQVSDPQYRADGSGLGLAITQRLLWLMQSQLQVQSTPGQGSSFTFEVELPIVEQATDVPQDSGRLIVGYEGPRQRVLVVGDEPLNRNVLGELLAAIGFEVDFAANGEEAIVTAHAQRPVLILMDQRMPGMSGNETTQHIRQSPDLHSVVIYTVSASAFEHDQQQSLAAGSDAFLAKPVHWHHLMRLLEQHLALPWIYEDSGPAGFTAQPLFSEPHNDHLVLPPPPELATLYELALLGNMRAIATKALELEALDKRYAPFAGQVRSLATRFQEKALLALMEEHLGSEQGE